MQFSKIIVLCNSIFAGVIVIVFLIIWGAGNKSAEEIAQGMDVLKIICTQCGVVATGYFAKSGVENCTKIRGVKKKKNNEKEEDNDSPCCE